MREGLQAILDLQPSWVGKPPDDDMARRGRLLRSEVLEPLKADLFDLAAALDCAPTEVRVEGKGQMGNYSRVPWVRIANAEASPTPREGWYLVYLFSEDGQRAYLSVNQGTTTWDGSSFRRQADAVIAARATWARGKLGQIDPRALRTIELGDSPMSRGYELGNVLAFEYRSGAVPDDAVLADDRRSQLSLLRQLYTSESQGTTPPGETAPEVLDAESTAATLAGKSPPRASRFRANASERRAIEDRAMTLATEYFVDQGATVENVSARASYDLRVELGGQVLCVEVKGTTSDGTEVLLTRGEVELHRHSTTNSVLAVASQIELETSREEPIATGGVLRIISPWVIEDQALTPVSFRYAVPAEQP